MLSADNTVLAIIIVLFLFCMMSQQRSTRRYGYHERFADRSPSPCRSCAHSPQSRAHPRELLNNQLDDIRGRSPAHHAPRAHRRHRLSAPQHMTSNPWDPATNDGRMPNPWDPPTNDGVMPNPWDPATNDDRIASAEREQWATPGSSYDHMASITDLVVDPRTQDQHRQWTKNMSPFSGRPMLVDNMEEAFAQSHPFTGFSRPRSVVQNNPLQVTEADHSTFSDSKRVVFNG